MTESALVPRSSEAQLTTRQILEGLYTVKSVLAPDLSDDEMRLFAMVASRSGLDPFAKQIFAIKRSSRNGPARVTFQTGIDGYRSIAARTGLYDGQDEPEFGPFDGGHPEWCTVRVYRKGVGHAIAATAYWSEYVPAEDFMWRKMPRVMLAKVAEALALRKAFPYDPENRQGIGADIYTADEMAQADRPQAPRPTLADVARQRAQEAPQHAPEPEAAPDAAQPVEEAVAVALCDSVSPYEEADPPACVLKAGHAGNHRGSSKESWS